MKIGIDISQIVYQTGVSRYTAELVRHLIDLKTEHQFYLFSGSLKQRSLLRAFVAELKTAKVNHRLTFLSPKLSEFFWNRLGFFGPDYWLGNVDLFHASNWALPNTQAKLVTTIHDLTFLKYPETHTAYLVAAHTRHLKKAFKKAHLVLTDSYATKKDLIDWGMQESLIKVVYPAAADHFKPESNQKELRKILEKYNLKKPFLLSVATQEPRKNLKRLIEAFKQLKPKYPQLSLALVGKIGWGETTRPIEGIKLLGFVPEADLPGLYSAARGFVYPSLYEGFGFPILEAMACGTIVVTSNISSMPELGGKAAIYVNPNKAANIAKGINQLLSSNSSRQADLRAEGFRQAQKFSWQKTAKDTLTAYQQLVSNSK
jgi:glycosyltransferase involved in cell wall biosynthesis